MIKVQGLTKRYGRQTVLNDVSFAIPPGELYAYLGPNGAGKTTTVRILTGLTCLSGGSAFLDGVDVTAQPRKAKERCGVVFQSNNLDGDLSVRENLEIYGRLYGLDRATRRRRMDELLDFAELSDRAGDLAGKLSGGQARRLMIARALIHSPRILFLDEPSVGLDPDVRRRLWALIKQVQSEGATIFLTTHYIEEAEFLADRVAFLDEGSLVRTGTPAELTAQMGAWAVDVMDNGLVRTKFFPDREEAGRMAAEAGAGCTVRPVNLEDCFLSLTGKRVQGRGMAGKHNGKGHPGHGGKPS